MNKKVLVIGFDWNGLAYYDPSVLVRKLVRDHIASGEVDIVLWEFAPTAGELPLSDHVRVINRRGRFRHLRPLYDLLAPWLLVRDLRRTGFVPDAVVLYDFPLLPAAERVKQVFGSRVVLYLTNLPADLAKTRSAARFKGAYHRFFERRASSVVDAVVAINDTTRAYARSLGIPDADIVELAPDTIGPDESFIRSAKKGVVHARFAISENTKIVFSVGRLEPEKGFDRLIRALAMLARADLALVIAGEGRLRSELEALTRSLGVSDRVHFAGMLGREDLWQFYADADVFMLLSRSEALGLVVWEAMHAGVPVIVSGAGGLAESVGGDGERGFMWTEERGIADLSQKLNRCFDREAAGPMLERAKAYVRSRQKGGDFLTVLSSISS